MADYTITSSDVISGGAAYIPFVDQADACMEAKGVADDIGKQLKILAVNHLVSAATTGGTVQSERAVSGASRTYAAMSGGDTGYLNTLRDLDSWGCVTAIVSNNGRVQLRAVGRYAG